MKFAFAILILISVAAQAKTFDLRDFERDQYVQLHPGDGAYEKYRAMIRSLMKNDENAYAAEQLVFRDAQAKAGPTLKFVGFELPSMTKMYGVAAMDRSLESRGYRSYRPLASNPVVDSDLDQGAVFVPTCRNPQGPLDLDDPMNERRLSCYPSLMIFVKKIRR